MNPPLLQTYHRVSWCPPHQLVPELVAEFGWQRMVLWMDLWVFRKTSSTQKWPKCIKMLEDIGQLPGSWTHLDWCQASKWWNERDVRDAFLAEGYSFWIRSYCCGDCSPKQMRYVTCTCELGEKACFGFRDRIILLSMLGIILAQYVLHKCVTSTIQKRWDL